MAYRAVVIEDSMSPEGMRLTTIEATYPLFIHAELLTHRNFSRNASSNRAIPIKRIIGQVYRDPVVPVWWGKTQRGMVAETEMQSWRRWLCIQIWLKARYIGILVALLLMWLGLHRQLVNRILGPWQWITTIFTATEWENFYALRCHPDAQPETQTIARMMQDAMEHSYPLECSWHLPYIQDKERDILTLDTLIKLSVARCARVSYLANGDYRPDADLKLYSRLVESEPVHSSPMEHVALASDPDDRAYNLTGWYSWRFLTDTRLAETLCTDVRESVYERQAA